MCGEACTRPRPLAAAPPLLALRGPSLDPPFHLPTYPPIRTGIPEDDMNAWADSCPSRAGYDELGNYMTYNDAVCFAAVGHITRGQAERMHYVTSERNPVLYAWGQYYASTSAPPPPITWPAESYNNSCKVGWGARACVVLSLQPLSACVTIYDMQRAPSVMPIKPACHGPNSTVRRCAVSSGDATLATH